MLAWLPVPTMEIDGLPDCLDHAHRDGLDGYPTDPARVTFYAPPISCPHLRPDVVLCNARGLHGGGTPEMALTLTPAALRGVPDFVRNQAAGHWQEGIRPSLSDAAVLIVGYGSIGAAAEERREMR